MRMLLKFYVFLTTVVLSGLTFADTPPPYKLEILNASVQQEKGYTIDITLAIAAIVGLVLVVHAIHKIRTHPLDNSGTGGNWRIGVVQLFVGGLLFSIPTIALLIGSSFFHSSQNVTQKEACVIQQISSGDYSSNC